ncbi:hypothetical protein Tco_0057534 [Tanacetum coccineum]
MDPKRKGKGILEEIESWEKIKKQARIDADYELAARMTQEEQEKYTIEERARLLAEFFKRRKKQLAAERAEAIRNKSPTKTTVNEVDYEPLSKKFPIMNWEYQLLGKMEDKDYLRMIFDPDEKDELWMNQLDWKLLRWKLYESCGVHTLFLDVKKGLKKKVLVTCELIKFIKSLLEE